MQSVAFKVILRSLKISTKDSLYAPFALEALWVSDYTFHPAQSLPENISICSVHT